MLRLVIPKGSLEELTLGVLEQADLHVRRSSSRDYHGTIEDPRIDRVSILRPQEIPLYIQEGYFDLGITGRDWVEETEAEVEILAELAYSGRDGGQARIVLAVPDASPVASAAEMPPDSRISTEYPTITRTAFEKLGIPVRVFLSYGATEAKVPEIVDAVVEVTESGSTLRRNGLKIIEVLLETGTVLIANRDAVADPAKRRAMAELQMLIEGALDARGRVLVKLNVGEEDLDRVVEILPSMKAPTVSKLSSGHGYAVETVVPKATINVLIPRLKELGASDIVELPIAKIVP